MIRFALHAAAVINAWPFHAEAAGGGDEFNDHVGHAHSLPRENGQTMASRIPKHPVGVPVRVLRSNGPLQNRRLLPRWTSPGARERSSIPPIGSSRKGEHGSPQALWHAPSLAPGCCHGADSLAALAAKRAPRCRSGAARHWR
jgi:hypothetical protein